MFLKILPGSRGKKSAETLVGRFTEEATAWKEQRVSAGCGETWGTPGATRAAAWAGCSEQGEQAQRRLCCTR